jgi:hypothetical protein
MKRDSLRALSAKPTKSIGTPILMRDRLSLQEEEDEVRGRRMIEIPAVTWLGLDGSKLNGYPII